MDRIMIVGASGGSYVALALQFTCKELHVVDFDRVDVTNLNRLPFEVGKFKVHELEKFIKACKYFSYPTSYSNSLLLAISPDIVIDCTDNIESQLAIVKDCEKHGIKYIKIGSNNFRTIFTETMEDVWDFGPEGGCGRTIIQLPEVCMLAAGLIGLILRKDYWSIPEKGIVIEWDKIIERLLKGGNI